MSKRIGWLVDCESGTIGRNLEKHSTWLAEVNRLEIITIELWRDVVAKRCELGANAHLLGFAAAAECDVMHCTGTHDARPDAGHAAKIDNRTRSTVTAGVAKNTSLFSHEPEAEGVGEELAGELVGIQPESDRIESTDCVLGGNTGGRPPRARVDRWMRDELAHESFVILERDNALVFVARRRLLKLHPLLDKSLDPEADRTGKDRE